MARELRMQELDEELRRDNRWDEIDVAWGLAFGQFSVARRSTVFSTWRCWHRLQVDSSFYPSIYIWRLCYPSRDRCLYGATLAKFKALSRHAAAELRISHESSWLYYGRLINPRKVCITLVRIHRKAKCVKILWPGRVYHDGIACSTVRNRFSLILDGSDIEDFYIRGTWMIIHAECKQPWAVFKQIHAGYCLFRIGGLSVIEPVHTPYSSTLDVTTEVSFRFHQSSLSCLLYL